MRYIKVALWYLLALKSDFHSFGQATYFRNIKLEDRICTLCQLEEIVDESHIVLRCPCYSNIKHHWLNNIQTKCEHFVNLIESNETPLYWLSSVYSGRGVSLRFLGQRNFVIGACKHLEIIPLIQFHSLINVHSMD